MIGIEFIKYMGLVCCLFILVLKIMIRVLIFLYYKVVEDNNDLYMVNRIFLLVFNMYIFFYFFFFKVGVYMCKNNDSIIVFKRDIVK